jgi:lipopolysaccharide transport system permease protein
MNLSLIINFTKQDLIDRYSGSVLGGAWSFINPLVTITIFVLIFSQIMGAKLAAFGVEFGHYGYSIYLISGVLAWNAFAGMLGRTTNIFRDKAGLIGKVNISLALLPIYIILSETVIFIISMIIFVFFLMILGFPITWHWLLLPLLYILQVILAYSLGFLFATLSVFIRDIREFVNVVLQLWFWFTPIVYVINILPDKLQIWFQLNPMFLLMNAYRDIIVYHKVPELTGMTTLFVAALILLLLSQLVFAKLERDLRDFI